MRAPEPRADWRVIFLSRPNPKELSGVTDSGPTCPIALRNDRVRHKEIQLHTILFAITAVGLFLATRAYAQPSADPVTATSMPIARTKRTVGARKGSPGYAGSWPRG